MKHFVLAICLFQAAVAAEKNPPPSALDRYIEEATQRGLLTQSSPGSLYVAGARLGDIGRDLRAVQVDDLVTVVVSDRASAVAKGTTTSSRKSSVDSSIGKLAGPIRAAGPWANLAQLGSSQSLDGQGGTTRESSLTTTVTARVTHVLPNGYLVLEGVKDVIVNSERQQVTLRGVVRWNDMGPANMVRSDRLANLEIHINGKGVVGDAIRRPNFLYRLLLGLLPF